MDDGAQRAPLDALERDILAVLAESDEGTGVLVNTARGNPGIHRLAQALHRLASQGLVSAYREKPVEWADHDRPTVGDIEELMLVWALTRDGRSALETPAP